MPKALDGSTICAISTPPGAGGIAVIRISGPEALRISSSVFSKPLTPEHDRTVVFGCIFEKDQIIDEGLALVLCGPGSYTGEDTVEFNIHGSTFIQEQVTNLLILAGCRLAGPGEFTQRAFLNGKLDLTQAEATADLIASEHSGAHKLAVEQIRGKFSREIGELRDSLIKFAGLLELELDFSEEDVEFADRTKLLGLIDKLLGRVTSLADSFRSGNAIKSGVRVAILGAPNAGKSTLLNALVGDERAIVSDIAGTTRDVIEDTCEINGTLFRFIDTAGIRETSDVIEAEGIKRAINKASSAHTVLYLLDSSSESFESATDKISELELSEEVNIVAVWNKIDLQKAPEDDLARCSSTISISASSGEGIEAIKTLLVDSHSIKESASSLIITTYVTSKP